ANTEKRPQIAITREIENNTLTKLVMGNALPGLKCQLSRHAPPSGDPQMEQTCWPRTLAQQDFLRILVGLPPQDASQVDLMAMRRLAHPAYLVGGRVHLDTVVATGQPEHQRTITSPLILKGENGGLDHIAQPHFGILRCQQV